MTILLPALAFAFAAFCIWLTVRIVNRRERWAKRTALGLAIALIAYPLSWGPALFVYHKLGEPHWMVGPMMVYEPVVRLLPLVPSWILKPFRAYSDWWYFL